MKTLLKKLNKIWLGVAIGIAFVLSLSLGCVLNTNIETTPVSAESTLSVEPKDESIKSYLPSGKEINTAIK